MNTLSPVFTKVSRERIEQKVSDVLNTRTDFLSAMTSESPRAAGDAIEAILTDEFQGILGDLCGEYSDGFARRAMADLAFKDSVGNYHVVDVKTHRDGTAFNMPNLTSVDRLARFYEDDANYFDILMVKYSIAGTKVSVTAVHFLPIEHLAWDCLTVGALGKGQIQIANAKHLEFDVKKSRRSWMLEFCDTMLEFYPKELRKISTRIKQFEKVKEFWLAKPEIP